MSIVPKALGYRRTPAAARPFADWSGVSLRAVLQLPEPVKRVWKLKTKSVPEQDQYDCESKQKDSRRDANHSHYV
jgi:hypothetical protein